jgi:hypothetical protein
MTDLFKLILGIRVHRVFRAAIASGRVGHDVAHRRRSADVSARVPFQMPRLLV